MKNNCWKLYLVVFFHNLIPAYVIERLFSAQRGLSIRHVVYCEMIYAAVVVLLELPSGMLADRLGRKKLLVAGGFLSIVEFVILIGAYRFSYFALVAFLAGISRACTSGAIHALLYDSLLLSGEEDRYEYHLGRMNALDFTAGVCAALSGGLLANRYGLSFNYWLSALSMTLSFLAILSLREPERGKQHETAEAYFFREVISGLSVFKNNRGMAWLAFQGMLAGSCLTYLYEFWQLYLQEISFSVLWFGPVLGGMMVARIPGSILADWLLNRFSAQKIFLGGFLLMSGGLLLMGLLPGWWGIGAMLLVSFAMGPLEPVLSGYVQHRTESGVRATIGSVLSLGERAVTMVIGLGFAYVSERTTILSGFLLLGLILSWPVLVNGWHDIRHRSS